MRRGVRILLIVAAVLAAGLLIAVLVARPAPDHAWFEAAEGRMLVIAHQGGDGLWPGDTLFAMERAAALGADVLEMDIHMTADGAIVLMHDDTVDRTTDGTGAISQMTLADIQALDAGYDWTEDDGQTFPYRGQGIGVPTLEEIFTAFPDMLMNIEIKQTDPVMVEPFCQLIRDYGMEDKVLAASFDDDTVRAFRETCPEVATSAATNEVVALFVFKTLFLAPAYSPPALAVQVPEYRSGLHVLTPRFVTAAHRRNVDVHPWTINEEADMQRMIDLGVDGIITDYPDRLLEVLGR
jgi:glycerophosphoryl diester phosphodiesterase